MVDFVYNLWNNYGVPAIVISILSWLLTYAIKVPYKLLTGRIQDKDFRHLANIPIAFIPVGVGIGLWYLYSYIFATVGKVDQMLLAGVFCGVGAILLYLALGERIEAALSKLIKNKKIAATVCSTEQELAAAKEVADTVATADEPAKATKKLFAKKVKEAVPDDTAAVAKKMYEQIMKK